MVSRHAVVVGGGIGGLSAAVGLREAGWRVTVVERAPRFEEIGAGIMLWPNALRALHALGLGERVSSLSTPQVTGGVHNRRGALLMRTDHADAERRLGGPFVGIHRAKLLAILRDALPSAALRHGTRVTGVTERGELTVESGTSDLDEADLVVGADGIGSRVRGALWPEHPGPARTGTTDWRAVIDAPDAVRNGISWGPGTEFGSVPLSDGRLYWYASLNADADTDHGDTDHGDDRAFLLEQFRSWHDPVPRLIESTPPHRLLRHDGYFLRHPLPSYVRGRVALLGDAAHAMAPNLGQGGCQAIEDAVELASALSRRPSVPEALDRYDSRRRPRSQRVARAARRMGRFGQRMSNPVAVGARDALVRLTPSALSMRAMATFADWTPPEIRPSR